MAVLGLLCVMILPAPGVWGILIGTGCLLAIVVSVALLVLAWISGRILDRLDRVRARRRRRTYVVHAGSGMPRKL